MAKHKFSLTEDEVKVLNEFFNFGNNLAQDSETLKPSLKQDRAGLRVYFLLRNTGFDANKSEETFAVGKVDLRWYVKFVEYGNDSYEPGDFERRAGIDSPEKEEWLLKTYNSGIKKLWKVLYN